ncbi:hypothetical protein [Nocardioides nitrophenolicus]|uniref:hypothetical protein n=1 Tax=Nocardioides nitrophenolicus TaxID=60489 RepID=UPI00195B1E55|nr:hypothetical protein [Nocardioides nitrophenolicus]MBM7516766.1 hypothetical protein [Nocardioides nitrophenolicus]
MRPIAVPTLLLAAVLTGCGTEVVVDPGAATAPGAPSSPTTTTTAGPTEGVSGIAEPPPFRVQYDGQELVLHPTSYCFGGGCVDGVRRNPTAIGAASELRIHVPVERFELEVSLSEVTAPAAAGDRCVGRAFPAPVEDLGGGWYLLRPFGPAATYDVGLFASGGGDLSADLRWTMPAGAAQPEPSARLAVVADHDGRPDSYGVGLAVDDLAASPRTASAEIEVTAGNGRSTTITPRLSRRSCAGDLFFAAPEREGRAAAALGDFPFTMTVTLSVDGVTHTATAVYPDDEIEGNEPSVALTFDPPLPGL